MRCSFFPSGGLKLRFCGRAALLTARTQKILSIPVGVEIPFLFHIFFLIFLSPFLPGAFFARWKSRSLLHNKSRRYLMSDCLVFHYTRSTARQEKEENEKKRGEVGSNIRLNRQGLSTSETEHHPFFFFFYLSHFHAPLTSYLFPHIFVWALAGHHHNLPPNQQTKKMS